jgi:hypothetical protein
VHEYLRLSALEPHLMGMRRKVVIVGGAGGFARQVPGAPSFSCRRGTIRAAASWLRWRNGGRL